ncbi:MAG: c-type cytochrome [Pseudomonadota bacterium]|nr:MAG: cytochrome c5 family protein [Pseudomonadota bacterium]
MKDEGSSHAHSSPIKTPKQLIVVVVLAFLIPVVGIILLTQLVTSSKAPSAKALDPEAVAERIRPVADVAISAEAAGGAPGAAAGGTTEVASGDAVYNQACAACHGTGVAGAPKFGDKGAWAPRIAKGKDALYTSALKGLNAMPPKGGNPSLADDAVKAAVDYMVNAAK